MARDKVDSFAAKLMDGSVSVARLIFFNHHIAETHEHAAHQLVHVVGGLVALRGLPPGPCTHWASTPIVVARLPLCGAHADGPCALSHTVIVKSDLTRDCGGSRNVIAALTTTPPPGTCGTRALSRNLRGARVGPGHSLAVFHCPEPPL